MAGSDWPKRIEIGVSELYLDTENPRHKPVENEAAAILRLCEKENILDLANDIVENGLNPLELFAIFPANPDADPEFGPYIVAEGNRRLCALKLLADPENAPQSLVEKFRALSSRRRIASVTAQLFPAKDDARTWLERLHSSDLGGRGRKPWSAEQKARFQGGGRHARAQQLLDIAERAGLISEAERAGKLSVVDRWISNPIFREAIGIDFAKGDDNIRFTRPASDVKFLLEKFMELVKKGEHGGISTRAKADEMAKKGREIEASVRSEVLAGRMEGTRTDPTEWGSDVAAPPEPDRSTKSPKNPQRKRLPYNRKLEQAVESLGIQKLQHLYFDLTKVPLDHTSLLAVGLWSFYEVLTANMGKNEGTAISDFMTIERIASLGFSSREQKKSLPRAFRSVTEAGNLTKHDKRAAQFDKNQLYNDLETLEGVTIAMVESITPKSGS